MPKWEKGNAPGAGRPPGRRNRSTIWLDELGAEGIETVIAKVKDRAVAGDMMAAAIVLARVWPRRRGRPVPLDLPAVETPAGLVQAQAALVAAMARGEVTPDEAATVTTVLENQRRSLETLDHERRLQELEATRAARPASPLWQTTS